MSPPRKRTTKKSKEGSDPPAARPVSQRRTRTKYEPHHVALLKQVFARFPYPGFPMLEELGKALEVDSGRLQVWFQNKRARDLKSKQKRKQALLPKDPCPQNGLLASEMGKDPALPSQGPDIQPSCSGSNWTLGWGQQPQGLQMPHPQESSAQVENFPCEQVTTYTIEGSSMVCFQNWRARHLMSQRRRQNAPPEDPSSQNMFLNNHFWPNNEIWQNAEVPAQRPGNQLSCPGRNWTLSWGQQPQGYQVSHQQETCVQIENISYGTGQAAASADNFQVGPEAGGTQAGARDGGLLYNHSQLPVSDYAPAQTGAWDGGLLYNHSQLPVSDYAPANGCYTEGNGLWLYGNEQLRMQVFPPQQNSAPGGPMDSFLTPQRSPFSGESSSTAYWGSTSDLSSCSTHHSQ